MSRFFVCFTLALIISCATAPPPPAWVRVDDETLQTLPEFAGQVVFRFEEQGKNPEVVKLWANSFGAPSELSRRISIVISRIVESGEISLGGIKTSTYKEALLASTKLHISSYAHLAEFGQQRSDGYHYWVLYGIAKADFERFLVEAKSK